MYISCPYSETFPRLYLYRNLPVLYSYTLLATPFFYIESPS